MKNILRTALTLVFLAALAFALIVMLKPGAAVFYRKTVIQPEQIARVGEAFEYRLNVDQRIFDPATLLTLENGKVLESTTVDALLAGEKGGFAIKETAGDAISVLFAPTGTAGPSGEPVFQAYIRPFFFASNWGGRLMLLLLFGAGMVLIATWRDPQKRAALLDSLPASARARIDRLFPPATSGDVSPAISRANLFKQAATNTVLIAFFTALMEWIFFVTKPSFMDIIGLGEKIKILFHSGFMISIFSLLTLPVIVLLELLIGNVLPSIRKYAFHVPASLLGASVILLLIDNFTYTVFKFGIVNSNTIMRAFYGLLFIGLVCFIAWKIARSVTRKVNPRKISAAIALIFFSLILVGFSFEPQIETSSLDVQVDSNHHKPHIIFLSTDGLNAANMSVYGYQRETTPFITQFAKTSLMSENNFTNAAHSTGSDTALLTGKLPFETRVLFPPDTLKGSDAFQHLPGILKRHGYRTVSLGLPVYVDVNLINFQNAFDEVQCQPNNIDGLRSRLSGFGYDDSVYFFAAVTNRIRERVSHILFIEDMKDPLLAVQQSTTAWITDQGRLSCLYSYLNEAKTSEQPLFAHVHLLATHGPKFASTVEVFSKGQEQNDSWMTDFYDDAILSFDLEVQRLVSYLKDQGLYENTILVIYTDHGQMSVTMNRLPLIIHFPADKHAGVLSVNTQNIDIAPTVLDYMQVEKPDWMQGSTLLKSVDPHRLILAGFGRNFEETSSGNFAIASEAFKPPFYQFGGMTVIQCHRLYTFDLENMTIHARDVEGYTSPCPSETLDSQETIKQKAGELLIRFGFMLPDNW